MRFGSLPRRLRPYSPTSVRTEVTLGEHMSKTVTFVFADLRDSSILVHPLTREEVSFMSLSI